MSDTAGIPFSVGPEIDDIMFNYGPDIETDGIAPGDVIGVGGVTQHGFPCQGMVVTILDEPKHHIHILVDRRSISEEALSHMPNPGSSR